MSEPQSAVPANVRPTIEDPRAWNAFWAAQGMSWRTAPELSAARHAYLAERRAIIPGIPQGIYPFKGVEPKLTRAENRVAAGDAREFGCCWTCHLGASGKQAVTK